jgi:branched-chain amino acid transport system ATP-binding protein
MASSTNLLEVSGVTVAFRGLVAVDDVSLTVQAGERVGLIGPNGAGKSTLLGVIGGQTAAARGTVRFDGRDLTSEAPHRRASLGIGRTFQDGRPFLSLTAAESIKVGAAKLRGGPAIVSPERLLEEVGLSGAGNVLCNDLSYVDRKKLEVARALGIGPRLLLLDEPFSGLTWDESKGILAMLSRVTEDHGLAVVVVEHVVRLVMELCQRVVVMNDGHVIADGPPDEVRHDRTVIEAYLGTPPTREHGESVTDWHVANNWDLAPIGLSADRICVDRERIPVVHDVDLSVRQGQIACLLGPNGAGKTTLMECLSGILRPSSGAISTPSDGTVSLVHQSRGLFPTLSLQDNLLLALHGLSRRERQPRLDHALSLFPWMPARSRMAAGNLSGGEQQMLAVARALITRPSILLLDEPSIGIAPIIIQQIVVILEQLAEEGTAILIAEQAIDYVLQIASHGYVLEQGRVVAEGSHKDLSGAAIVKAYFGDVVDYALAGATPTDPLAQSYAQPPGTQDLGQATSPT